MAGSSPFPTRFRDLRAWVRRELQLPADRENALLDGVEALLARERADCQQTNAQDVSAAFGDFAARLNRLVERLSEREATITDLTEQFEKIVAGLADQANRDPKTRLVNFPRFFDHLAAHVASMEPGGWCAVGFVDIRSFKACNDEFGHAVGDQVIQTVARLLREHIRLNDVVAHQLTARAPDDLHARFGGDEFCFLIPHLERVDVAAAIATRFRHAVDRYDWATVHEPLGRRPIAVDVGVACLRMGPLEERVEVGEALAQELLMYADKLMYLAKADRANRSYVAALCVKDGTLSLIDEEAAAS
jgi:diguanylate cyclase (GGDEF)-like protein